MTYRLDISPDAQGHLRALRKYDQTRLVAALEISLTREPSRPTRSRKLMRSNLIATWELRVGDLRAYYDVDVVQQTVLIRAIGIKHHGSVTIGGEQVNLS